VTDTVSQKRISELDTRVQAATVDFINEVEETAGVTLRVVQGYRTFEEQDALYAQGRTQPGPIVTNARGGQSYHNYGLAIDVAGLNANGSINWKINYVQISKIAKYYGFEWGGNFSRPDRPHFQMTFGLTVEQLEAGKIP
jgi:LAS superfamily LD-carboxypeptidase LdcB